MDSFHLYRAKEKAKQATSNSSTLKMGQARSYETLVTFY
jgi:hypothetical protein